jgi:hypothetical protein
MTGLRFFSDGAETSEEAIIDCVSVCFPAKHTHTLSIQDYLSVINDRILKKGYVIE